MQRMRSSLISGFAIIMMASLLYVTSAFVSYASPTPSIAPPSINVPGTNTAANGNAARSGNLETRDANGSRKSCSDYGVLTGAIVPCIMFTVETTGQKIAIKFADMMRYAVYAYFVLVITFFGVKILQGEGQVGQKSALLAIKIAFVLGFLQLMPSLIPQVHAVMKESTELVANVLADPADFHCNVSDYRRNNGALLWAQMDCVLGKLFGFVSGSNGTPNMMLAASGIGLLSGFLVNGTFGLFVFFGILGVLFNLFQFVMKTVLAYVNGFIVATLLIIIAPLFLPLALMQVTAQYFDKWWKGILAAILMPIVITAYVMLGLMLYDKMMFADDSIVKQMFDRDYMAELQRTNEQACSAIVGNDQTVGVQGSARDRTAPRGEAERNRDENVINSIFPTLSGNNSACISYSAIAASTEMMRELFYDLAKLLITSIVITTAFKFVQDSVRSITGSGMATSAIDPVSNIEKAADAQIQSFRSGMENATDDRGNRIGDMRGADFLGNVPRIFGGGVEGLMRSMGIDTSRPAQANPNSATSDTGSTASDTGGSNTSGTGSTAPANTRSAAPDSSLTEPIDTILNGEANLTGPQRQALSELRASIIARNSAPDDLQEQINRIMERQ